MKAAAKLLSLSFGLTALANLRAAEGNTEAESHSPPSNVHGRIAELLRQDLKMVRAKAKDLAPPPFAPPSNDQPVAEGVLNLEPIKVTQKKAIELPLRIKPVTLDNFFYGDGAIYRSASGGFSISSGPDALIKFNFKF